MALRRIMLPHGCIKKIADSLKCDPSTVRFALRGATDSELSRKIRHEALTYYNGRLC